MDIFNAVLTGVLLPVLTYYGIVKLLGNLRASSIQFPEDIDVVGPRKEFLSVARASLRQIFGGISTLLEGYQKHAQHGKPYIVYDASARQELLLPFEHVSWFASQPDSRLSSYGVRQERHAVKYLHMGIEQTTTMHFIERISGDALARNLHLLQPSMYAELQRCIDRVFGLQEGEWTEVKVYSAFEGIIFPAMTRALLGLELSCDEHFLCVFRRYIMALGLGTIFVGELPKLLKGMVARVVRLPLLYYRNKTLGILTPVVQRELTRLGEMPVDKTNPNKEYNFIWQCARVSEKNTVGGMGTRASAAVIAEWIMSLGFAGSSSTVIQATNLLLDMANCPAEDQVVPRLRKEAQSVLENHKSDAHDNRTNDSMWHLAAPFKNMPLADSLIRESLRFHPILIKGLTKEVVHKDGIVLPGSTVRMPAGSWVGVPVLGIHRDERFYTDPQLYRPFRYVDSAESLDASKPTPTYLGFGYGKHACPGRWFAVLMLKMIIAYIVLNYDIEAGTVPPKMSVLGDAALPPISTTIRVRRRRA
ncbi:Fumitremorgin C monooxygenase [Cytospora mali]|uniref:Fumitremorgin C monooxygenase n=1 Tax=Cytospora mali TaxID=578113 RepID=A0A194VIT0_CYTMA|nr:Fumitremorgin C monooxygenase [Valsa mali]